MNDKETNGWRLWLVRRIVLPLGAACIAAWSFWGGSMAMASAVMPFLTFLWTVLLRSFTKRGFRHVDPEIQLPMRSWYALDLFSGLLLAIFEMAVAASAAAEVLQKWQNIGIVAGFFLGYAGIAAYGQFILIAVQSQVERSRRANHGMHASPLIASPHDA